MGKIIRRILTIIPAVALQSLWLLLLMKWLTPYAPIIVSLLSVAAFFLVVFIIIKRDETAYKLLWLLVILSLPLVGALLYLLFGNKRTARPLKRRLQQVQKSCNPQPLPIKEAPFDGEKRMGQTVRWLEEKTQYPMCAVEQVRYYPLGDNMFPDMLADLKNARNSIYVEYFIIEPGHMWDAIVNELEVKMEQGVDVRVIYDDLGSISSFNFSNVRELKKKGIPCIPFNPFLALKGTANYRDHRKMLIIDNEVAYSGGINLADRYINLEHPYGHWKDTGFRITGEPVKNFTHMFLTFWNAFSLEKEAGQLAMPTYPKRYPAPPHTFDGYVLSYYDSPLNHEATSICEWNGSFSMHTKTILIDDRISIIGSFNWDMRSAYLDTEMMLLIDCPALNAILRDEAQQMMYEGKTISPDGVTVTGELYITPKVSATKQVLQSLLRIIVRPFRYVL